MGGKQEKQGTRKGWFWAVKRDDAPWKGRAPPDVVFFRAPGRGGEHAKRMMNGFEGILQVDGCGVYKQLAKGKDSGVRLASCRAHARRKFEALLHSGPVPIAAEAVRRIKELYLIERDVRGLDAGKRLKRRKKKSRRKVAELKAWAERHRARVSAKSGLGEAFDYLFNHWDGLKPFPSDGRVEIDSNSVEGSIRPVALNRKNALFVGHDEGGENWGIHASLIETCKLNGVDPFEWLVDTFAVLGDWPQDRIEELLPWNYVHRGRGGIQTDTKAILAAIADAEAQRAAAAEEERIAA